MRWGIPELLRTGLAGLLLAACVAATAAPQIQLDRNRLNLGETLTIQLTADGAASGEPDLAPLKKDFDLLSQGQSSVTSIVNGAISSTRQWTLELAPKRTGRLLIPAITLGKESTQPTTVEVVAAGGSPGTSAGVGAKPVFMEADASAKSPYVQQAFEYRVRVYFGQPPLRAAISEPTADGAIIQQSGKDRQFDKFVDGRHYSVIERRYQVIPQRSGTLSIQGPRLDAVVADPRAGAQRDPFSDLDEAFGGMLFQGMPAMPGLGAQGRHLVERPQDLGVEVRAQPAGAGAHWLPATSVQIADEWSPTPPVFKVGEPVTRTLTLTAEGATAAQLPDLVPGAIEGFQVYPDRPHAEDLPDASPPVAVKGIKIALVPTRAGTLTLPEIRVPWWDTQTDRPRVALVPARTIEVAPGAGTPSAPAPAPVSEPSPAAPVSAAAAERAGAAALVDALRAGGFWPWLVLGLVVAWLATLVWWSRERRARVPVAMAGQRPPDPRSESLGAARRRVEQACLGGDPRETRAALLAWAEIRWPVDHPRGLGDLGARLGGGAVAAVMAGIDRAVYAPSTSVWDGAAAWEALDPRLDASAEEVGRRVEDPLPGLYPRG